MKVMNQPDRNKNNHVSFAPDTTLLLHYTQHIQKQFKALTNAKPNIAVTAMKTLQNDATL